MKDLIEVIKNTETLYNSNSSLAVLKDFERVIDELDVYVYENWDKGEVIKGPDIERHWVTVELMWPHREMPNPIGAKRLTEYGCKIRYRTTELVAPREIKDHSDIRHNSKKGKLDRLPVWVVEVRMPKKLMLEMFRGYQDRVRSQIMPDEPEIPASAQAEQPVEQAVEPGTEQ